MKFFPVLLTGLVVVLAACKPAVPAPTASAAVTAPAPIPVKVVLVTMFEIGTDDDKHPGEFELWKQRRSLTQRFSSGGYHDLYLDPASGLLVMVTGIGTANSAASTMMLGMDPRFDQIGRAHV